MVEAYRLARDGELPPFNPPGSRFGGIIAFNRPVDMATAEAVIAPAPTMRSIVAPEFAPESGAACSPSGRAGAKTCACWRSVIVARRRARWVTCRAGWRAWVCGPSSADCWSRSETCSRSTAPRCRWSRSEQPTEAELEDLLFAWSVAKHVKSNAIVLARGGQTVGVGAGQMNRALPVQLAIDMAGPRAEGAVLASDAYFPMPDGPEHAARAGVRAIIQPGGARRDAEIIAVANRCGMAMVFTGQQLPRRNRDQGPGLAVQTAFAIVLANRHSYGWM